MKAVHSMELGQEIRRQEEAWHYEGGKRDLRLDLLRGFAALAMIADHIGGESSWLYPLTGGNQFFVSAAEAFVFISGAVMGIVYLNVYQKKGLASALMKAFQRAWTLYAVAIPLTLGFAAVASVLDLWWTPDLSNGGLSRFILDVVTLHRTIFLADILVMYVLMLLAAGPVILLLSQGRTALVVGISIAIWAVWQVSPASINMPWSIEGNEVFFFPAWQLLFVGGLVAGWHRSRLEAAFADIPRQFRVAFLTMVVVVVVGLYVAQVTNLSTLEASRFLQHVVFDKPNLPVGRVLVFAILAVFAFAAVTELWQPVERATGWLLLPLGQNALTAYCLHLFIVAITTKLTATWLGGDTSRVLIDTALQIAGVMAVWLIVVMEPKLTKPISHKVEACIQVCLRPLWSNAGVGA